VAVIKRRAVIAILSIILLSAIGASVFLGTGYALWRHNAEVRFSLTISQYEDELLFCVCGTYSTIKEGIEILRDRQYPGIYSSIDKLVNEIYVRTDEINNLPVGGITFQELSAERSVFMEAIQMWRSYITQYGTCINTLTQVYNNSSIEEKSQVPDFWSHHSHLWSLRDDLWDKTEEFYNALDEFWEVGEQKIVW
jgi:hypothetical protein